MKTAMAKITVLMLILACLLTGCNLITVDAAMQAQEDIAKIDKKYSAVAASYDGGEVTVAEAVLDFADDYNQTAYMYQMYLGTMPTQDEVNAIIENALTTKVQEEIIEQHFDAEYTLTDEEQKKAEKTAKITYDSHYDGAVDIAEGKTDEEKEANALVTLRRSGLDYDSVLAEAVLHAKTDKMTNILRDEITEVTDEELQAAYDEKVAADEELYSEDFGSFESAMTSDSTIVSWIPEGYRTVKHILVMPEDEVKTAYADAATALNDAQTKLDELQAELDSLTDDDLTDDEKAELRTEDEIRADIDEAEAALPDLEAAAESAKQACLENVKTKTDEIYAKLEAGEDFEALMAEYGEDPGMQNEPTITRGYYVSANSRQWDPSFVAGAMALANVGDVSAEPVVSTGGVHIIKYMSDAKAGAVALEEIRDAFYAETLETMKKEHSTEIIDGWVSEKNPVIDVQTFAGAYMTE